MMNSPLRFLPAIVTLTAAMAISGCQKETESTAPSEPTDTQSTSTEMTDSQKVKRDEGRLDDVDIAIQR